MSFVILVTTIPGWGSIPNYHFPPENSHDNGKSSFQIGDTSSNGCFSIVMLVFGGMELLRTYQNHVDKLMTIPWAARAMLITWTVRISQKRLNVKEPAWPSSMWQQKDLPGDSATVTLSPNVGGHFLPGKLRCPLKINSWKMYFLLKQ